MPITHEDRLAAEARMANDIRGQPRAISARYYRSVARVLIALDKGLPAGLFGSKRWMAAQLGASSGRAPQRCEGDDITRERPQGRPTPQSRNSLTRT